MKPDRNQIVARFFVAAMLPALIVGMAWYIFFQGAEPDLFYLDFTAFVLPMILISLIPAVIVAIILADQLARPIRHILAGVTRLADGDFGRHFSPRGSDALAQIEIMLNRVSAKLQETTSQAKAETALIAAERSKLNTVLNTMTDGVFAIDRSGRIILFNKAACVLTGRTITEVAGQLAEKVMPLRQNGELVMARWLATAAGADHKIGEWRELELYRADGRSLIVNVEAVVLKDDPNGIAALVTFHDLTKARQLEEMKIDFVALAAHELRTPLTEIKGYLDILSTEAKGLTKSQKQFLELAVDSAGQLSSLMHNLLNVARIEHGELSYNLELVDYRSFVQDIVAGLQDRAKQQARRLTIELPHQPLPILGDPSALGEVLGNLVTNAIAHTAHDTGTIHVEVKAHRTNIETIISDNGGGIPAHAIPHLFTKFYRVDALKSTGRGTGLGLYICKSILEAHDGSISVESTEGKGTTFTFILPRPKVAELPESGDNDKVTMTRGAHGWIKNHSVHRG